MKDVMQFLILRGHTRLIPQGGLAEFPDAILNSKRLDLYNLYREVCWWCLLSVWICVLAHIRLSVVMVREKYFEGNLCFI